MQLVDNDLNYETPVLITSPSLDVTKLFNNTNILYYNIYNTFTDSYQSTICNIVWTMTTSKYVYVTNINGYIIKNNQDTIDNTYGYAIVDIHPSDDPSMYITANRNKDIDYFTFSHLRYNINTNYMYASYRMYAVNYYFTNISSSGNYTVVYNIYNNSYL